MNQIQKELQLLGHEIEDMVTKAKGVVTSISFDLYGCVQALVRLPLTKEGKEGELFWFDTKRLKVLSKKPCMPQPEFVRQTEGFSVPGGEARKPFQ